MFNDNLLIFCLWYIRLKFSIRYICVICQNMWKIVWITILTSLCSVVWNATNVYIPVPKQTDQHSVPPFVNAGQQWVDSVFNAMTEDEKIGQLFMIAAYSNRDSLHVNYVKKMISEYHIGGLIFMQGGPVRQAALINEFQSLSRVPLLISMDAEWSLSMRLDSTVLYPRQMMLGAIRDENLIYTMGAEFARQLKRVGVQVSFSPVLDVNNNPQNPVINTRSFGEDPERVSHLGWKYAKGLQDNHVLAVGKHFPGHGDTKTDSHKDLPVIQHSRERLDSIEFVPFSYCIRKGMGGIMIAHLFVPALDSTAMLPTTLSQPVVSGLLRKEMGFQGLVFTDALNMQGVAKYYQQGEVELKALLAGNDVLLFSGDIPKAIEMIKAAVIDGRLKQEQIDESCKRILQAKYWAGLSNFVPIDIQSIVEDLNSPKALLLQQQLIESSLTLVRNEKNLIPLIGLDTLRIASVSFGSKQTNSFQNRLGSYSDIASYVYRNDFAGWSGDKIVSYLSKYDIVIASFHNISQLPDKQFGIDTLQVKLIRQLSEQTNVVLDLFGTPYALSLFDLCDSISAIVVSYNDWDITQDLSAQLFMGGIASDACLPVAAGKNFVAGAGATTPKIRLKYSRVPEDAGINSEMIATFDSIALSGITNGAYPGCQVYGARNGIVFYNKSFGKHTYEGNTSVKNSDVYDLASVTKVMATTLSLMKLYDQKKFDVGEKLSKYHSALDTTNKRDITFIDVLSHQACLVPWIPFYANGIKTDSLRRIHYSDTYSEEYKIHVAENMYMRNDFRDSLLARIYDSELLPQKKYKYSDLGMIIMGEIIREISGKTLDLYAIENFYKPLGANRTFFNPLKFLLMDEIIPTENDKTFRKQQLQGYVHDQASAMLGGVAGHAGLFSNANDLGKILQMLLQGGTYGAVRYFSEETVKYFTSAHFLANGNRRGLGFDKQVVSDPGTGPVCASASANSFGHSGFTGTYVWVDPDENLVFVFLCNRVYPVAENNKILSLHIRTNLHQAMYDAIIKD